MARCFVACFLTPESARALVDCCPSVPDARPVPLENLHVTLLFAGILSATEADELAAVCAGLEGRSPAATVKRVGAFPRGPRARMLAVELEDDEQLCRWHRELCLARPTAAEGKAKGKAKREKNAFRPHVTLCRSRRAQLMPELDCELSTVSLEVPRLYESQTLPTGARYRPWHTEAGP